MMTTYLSRTHFGSNEEKEDAEVDNEVDNDEDSAESDLHSIELNMDDNNKSFKWTHASAAARVSRRVSVDDEIRGRNSISGKFPRKSTSIQCMSDGVEWGTHTENIQNSGDGLNQERFHELDKQVLRKGYGDELQRYKPVKGLRDQILLSSGIGSVGDFPSPTQQCGHDFREILAI